MKLLIVMAVVLAIVGCAVDHSRVGVANSYGYSSSANPIVVDAVQALEANNPEYANELLNAVLSNAPRDPLANFLNGMAYQARAVGEGPLWDMAKIGYQLARKFDPYLWQASYLLGMMSLKERNPAAATVAFSEAIVANPNSAVPLYALAVASYTLGDISTAYRAVEAASRLDNGKPTLGERQITVLCTAAAGEFATATSQIVAMQTDGVPKLQLQWLEQKLRTWQEFYANIDNQPVIQSTTAETAPANATTPPRMANIEAIILRTAIADGQSRGVNLLDGLSAQFEGVLINSSRNRVEDLRTNQTTSDQNTLINSVQLSVPAVKYSLNIINSADSYSRMIGSPSVLALDGKESKFFIGSELTVFLPGYSSSAATKDFGLSIQVTPTFLTDDTVQLQVDSGLSTLNFSKPPGVSALDTLSLEKVTNTTSAVMRFGETLAVSTGTIYQESSQQAGVPVLNQTPIVDNFFSRRTANTSKGTLLILLTLKPYTERNTPTNPAAVMSATHPTTIRVQQQYLAPVTPQVQAQLNVLENRDIMRITRQTDVALPSPVYADEPEWRQRFFNDLLIAK